ncbi:MAG TPA: hypothetical protein VFY10_00125 [Dehalococcoidia bacterium]|nr:hypothetical protein [Dehalococcoidia bacterium]
MNLDVEFVDRHPILDVAVKAVSFLDQEDSARRGFLSEESNHFAKRRATGALRRLDVFEFLNDVDALTLRVFGQQLPLRWDGKSLFLLFG